VALILDTGPLVAALNARDPDHAACARLIAEAREPRIIPAPVLVEVEYHCRPAGPAAFAGLLGDVVHGAYRIADLSAADLERVRELLHRYADHRLGFVDAAVLAIVERLGEQRLATLDHRHFAALRPRHVAALELLPA
jgi:predicted nucleic acid-binding protein